MVPTGGVDVVVVTPPPPPAVVVPLDAPFVYTERRFPAPQSSAEFPAHAKEQSLAAAATDPAEKLFPQ